MAQGRYEVEAKNLAIVWANDNRYWRKPAENQPAELLQVCWLEVTGSVRVEDPSKKHRVTFEVSLTADAFGWNGTNLFVMGKKGNKGKFVWRKANLLKNRLNPNDGSTFTIPIDNELILTETQTNGTDKDDVIRFGLYEIWSGRWKGGLKIHRAIVQEVS